MDCVPAAQAAELLEAMIRHAMAEHAAIACRGFDSARDRLKLRNQIDAMLDEHALLLLEAAVS
ncbi:MAG: hypothetical protein ACXVGA_04280 [Mycobacteriaceae bacterium]